MTNDHLNPNDLMTNDAVATTTPLTILTVIFKHGGGALTPLTPALLPQGEGI